MGWKQNKLNLVGLETPLKEFRWTGKQIIIILDGLENKIY